MANLTITIEDELLKRARMRALDHGTSVNAILRDYLEHYAGLKAQREEASQAILQLSERATSGHRGRRWSRDELHER